MTTQELSLHKNYVRHWGFTQAIRELIQNAQDSAVDGHPMKVRHTGDKLVITNEGVVLRRNVLLLGKTSKEHRTDQAGQHGEGLKLGMLCLAREGYPVTIRNGSEVWTPKIMTSKVISGEEVLAIEIDTGRKEADRFQVEIGNVDAAAWKDMKWRFLSVSPRPEKDVIRTMDGSILLGSEDKGRVFVKGIYVCNNEGLDFGYDFREAKLDRDRNVMDDYDTAAHAREIVDKAVSQGKLDPEVVYQMMLRNCLDVQTSSWSYPKALQELAVTKFRAAHGDKAVPVTSMAEAADLEHLGAKPVIVPLSLQRMLEPVIGSIAQVRQRLSNEVVSTLQPDEVTGLDRLVLQGAIETLKKADPALDLPDVQVVVFRDENLRGTYAEGRVHLAHRILGKGMASVLRTLIHEVAHRCGKDGDKGHVAEIERLWEAVFASERLPF